MKQVGDKEERWEYPIGAEPIKTIYTVTQADVDAEALQNLTNDKNKLESELAELNVVLPDSIEEIYLLRKYKMKPNTEAKCTRKAEIRSELESVHGVVSEECIDTAVLTLDDTTELDKTDMLLDLLERIEALEGGA